MRPKLQILMIVAAAALTAVPFAVRADPPQASILSPLEGDLAPKGQTTHLQGEGLDSLEGAVPGSGLTWRSDRDGPLGEGASLDVRLSRGTHVIQLLAKDSKGFVGVAEVTVTITE